MEEYETSDDNRHQEDNYRKYLEFLGITEQEHREMLESLGIKVRSSEIPIFNGVCLGPIQEGMTGEDSEVRLDMNVVRKIGMMVDPGFLGELYVNGIVAEMIFRPGKKGEIPEMYREAFKKYTLEQNWRDPDWRRRHLK